MVTFKKKGEHTTYRIPLALTEEKHREIMREELSDVNRDVTPEKFLVTETEQAWTSPTEVTAKYHYKLGRFYVTRLGDYTPPEQYPSTVVKAYSVDPDKYWTADGYTIPSGYYNYLATYSRAGVMYPFVVASMKLPDLSPFPDITTVWFGLENGGTSRIGIASFQLQKSDGVVRLNARYGSHAWVLMDVTDRLPADHLTSVHHYYVKVNKWGAEFFIDNTLVAVGLDIPEGPYGVKATCPPYAIAITNSHVIKRMHTLLEIAFPYPKSGDIRPNPGSLTIPLDPYWFRWGEGDPNPPRAYRLYQADSASFMAGASISSGSLTSHPIPIYGREKVTLHFQATQTGTLLIEIMTLSGNWRTYDAKTVAADELLSYVITGNAVLARVTFTPDAYPATINDAEVVMV